MVRRRVGTTRQQSSRAVDVGERVRLVAVEDPEKRGSWRY